MYKKIKIIILISIIIFGLILVFKKNTKIKKTKIESEKKLKNPDVKLNQFKLQQILNDNNRWILKAQKGQLFKSENLAKCEQAKANFISKNNKIAELRANNISFDLSNSKITLNGNINSIIHTK